jgi:hypothetical protein
MTSDAVPLTPTHFRPVADFANVVRSEFCKLRSVRSTVWTLGAAMAFNVGLAVLAGIFIPGRLNSQEKATVDVVRLGLAGLHLSQIAFGVLGTLVITSEYGTGMIRATFSAVPQRRLVLMAKAIVLTVTSLVVGIGSSFAAFFAFQASLSEETFRTSIGDPEVLRAVAGGGLYLTALGLLGLGLGAIIRSSAGAIATLFGLLFVPPILLGLLPESWQTAIRPYVPLKAGSQIFVATQHDPASLGAWSGFGVFTLYTVLALVGGFALIKHRDA